MEFKVLDPDWNLSPEYKSFEDLIPLKLRRNKRVTENLGSVLKYDMMV